MSMSSWFRNVGLAFVAAATLSCGDDLGTPTADGGLDGVKAGDGGGNGGAAEAGGKVDSAASEAGTADAVRALDATVDASPNSTDAPLVVDTAQADNGQGAAVDASASGVDTSVDAPGEFDVQRDVRVYLDLASGDGSLGS